MKNKVYVLGSVNIDFNMDVDYIPKNGETIKGSNFLRNIGGKGFNQANAVASLGHETVLIAAVGHDELGRYAIDSAKDKGIDIDHIQTKNASTGFAMIIHNQNDNRIIIHGGANDLLEPSDIEAIKLGNPGDALVSQFEVPIDLIEESFKIAKSNQMITILNPAPANKLTEKLFKYTDYLILNQTEAEIITNIYPKNDEDIKKVAHWLMSKGIANVVITLGAQGSAFVNKNHFIVQTAFSGNVVDTTGAGDSFVGGFTHALLEEKDISKLLIYGNASGIYTCEIIGVEHAMPTPKDIKKIIERG